MGSGALDLKGLSGRNQGFAFEQAPEAFNFVFGPVGEVGQGAEVCFPALAPSFAEEDGGPGATVGDDVDIHVINIYVFLYVINMFF